MGPDEARRDTMNQTYSIGARHEAFGTEGCRTITGTAAEAIAAARQLAHDGGHGWVAFVFNEEGRLEWVGEDAVTPTAAE
jgi:hypothetical protein